VPLYVVPKVAVVHGPDFAQVVGTAAASGALALAVLALVVETSRFAVVHSPDDALVVGTVTGTSALVAVLALVLETSGLVVAHILDFALDGILAAA
jgi:hypothetical protein